MFAKFAIFGVLLLFSFSISECENVADLIHPVETEEFDAKVFEEILTTDLTEDLKDEEDNDDYEHYNHCDVDMNEPTGLASIFNFSFLKKFVGHFNVFKSKTMQMRFFLFRPEFPDCGHELKFEDDRATLLAKGFNPKDPTRILVHGWMGHSRGTFNKVVKGGYAECPGSFNIIVTDWSENSSNFNYFSVVTMIEGFGGRLADFTKHLHSVLNISFDDIYIVGHSLGAQIAGAAGKFIKPHQFNTIFALDPAGPAFQKMPAEYRIDPTDAKYVESIQTSGNLGFRNPTGNATFYPNWGDSQKNCHIIGCSHSRAYKFFAESLNSKVGFWGSLCTEREPKWVCENERLHIMGGEPSTPKNGLFYVDTNGESPYACGK